MKTLFLFFILSIALVAGADEFRIASTVTVAGAPKLNFILNEEYFITQTLLKGRAQGKYSQDVVAFQNRAWSLDQPTYQRLQKTDNAGFNAIEKDDNFLKTFSVFFSLLKNTPEYKLIWQETRDYMQQSAVEWDKNLAATTPFMLKYSGFNFSYEVSAYITHPAVGNGTMQSQAEKKLSFGAWPTFDNYFTVYIWHEIIHFHMQLDDVSHSVNQLLTDNELRVYLDGGSLEPLQGHSELIGAMESYLPQWEDYKKNPTDLNELVKEIQNSRNLVN